MYRTGQKIADELSLEYGKPYTRFYVYKTIKFALKKIYKGISREFPLMTPFERILLIAQILQVNTDKEFKSFFKDFPQDIREKVKRSLIEEGIGGEYADSIKMPTSSVTEETEYEDVEELGQAG